MNRRDAIKAMTAMAAASTLGGATGGTDRPAQVPLVHITDLYHPPQDPDDHLDLATIVALPEYDLRGVVLDVTRKFLMAKPEGWDIAREPGQVPVAQLGHLLGRTIPAAAGPRDPLAHPGDTAADRPREEQAGIGLLLDCLARSETPVTISVVGSCRVLAAAFNREPELLRRKTAAVLLNAGMTAGPKREWNVGLDPAAYVALWRSGLPIHWHPCATDKSAFDPAHERGTYWKVAHRELFRDLPAGLRGWLGYAFAGSQSGDSIRGMSDHGQGTAWEQVLAGERNMWSTISLATGAGRVLAKTSEGWRFLPAAAATSFGQWPCRLDPISASVDDEGNVAWQVVPASAGSPHRLFGRRPGAEYGLAMAEALNELLRRVG